MKGYIINCQDKPKEFKRYEDYYRHLVKEGNIDELFSSLYKITYKKMKKWSHVEKDIDQLTPIVSTAFMKAVRVYDPNREDASFLKLYDLFINREMIDEYYCTVNNERVIKYKYRDLELRLDATMDSDDTGVESYANVVPDRSGSQVEVLAIRDSILEGTERIFKQAEKEERADRNVKRDKVIFTTLLTAKLEGRKVSQKELSKELDITQSMVCRVWNKYLPKLENYVMEEC